jgi:hypothetical protein
MLTDILTLIVVLLAVIAYTLRQIRKILWEQAHDVEKILDHTRGQTDKK